jgi:hypothetical protein
MALVSRSEDRRRHPRLVPGARVEAYWQDGQGVSRCTQGRCLDISESGLRMETIEPIPVRTYINLRVDKFQMHGSASVRHSVRRSGKYILGVEFSGGLRWKAAKVEVS